MIVPDAVAEAVPQAGDGGSNQGESLSGSLAGLSAQRIDFGALQRDVCVVGEGSSLGLGGRGALSASASAPLRIRP